MNWMYGPNSCFAKEYHAYTITSQVKIILNHLQQLETLTQSKYCNTEFLTSNKGE